MKTLLKKILLCGLLSLVFITGAWAAPEEEFCPPEIGQNREMGKIEKALPEEAREALGALDLTDPQMGEKGLESLLNGMKDKLLSGLKQATASAVKILVIVMLCAAADSALDGGAPKEAVALCGAIAVSAIAAGNVSAFIGMGVETLHQLEDFSHVLLPLMCSAAVSAGAITSAAAKYAATTLGIDVLLTIGINVILPMIGVYLASVVAGAALGQDSLEGVSDLLKWACKTALTLLMLGFTAYLGMSGLISGKADEMALKLTKSAMGTLLPVVGGVLADTAETVIAGAGLLRNTIGVLGLLAVAAVCATPFIALGCHYLAYKAVAALSQAFTDKRMSELISGIGEAFGMVLALVGAGGLMLFFSLISSMRMVGGL